MKMKMEGWILVGSIVSLLFLLGVCRSESHSNAVTAGLLLNVLGLAEHEEIYELGRQELGINELPQLGVVALEADSVLGGKLQSVQSTSELNPETNRSGDGIGILSQTEECEATYGVLPCSTTVVGNLFLVLVYGYIMFRAAKFLSDGSELLLTVLDAGLIGGLLLPILGVLPDSLLILVSGLGGTKAEAQQQILVGIGLLAGSTVFLLTVLWGGCLILGRCDLGNAAGQLVARDKTLTRGFGLTGTGVTTDYLTKLSSLIMIFTVIPFIVAQLPKFFGFSAKGNIPVLIACVLSLGGLLAYCLYQVFSPRIQERRRAFAMQRFHKLFLMRRFVRVSSEWGYLIDEHGKLNTDFPEMMFQAMDRDADGFISQMELKYFINTTMGQIGEDTVQEALEHLMSAFDSSGDKKITKDELRDGLSKWLSTMRGLSMPCTLEQAVLHATQHTENEYAQFIDTAELDESDDDNDENPPSRRQIFQKSMLLMLGGTALAAVFADPLVDAVNGFSKVSKIPAFFVSFILLPLASNSSEAVSSLVFASRKKKKTMSLTYSQVYGGVTMNNTMGLGIFLAVVYGRQLIWDFSSEVLVIVLVTVVMGLLAGFRYTFPLWMAGIALSLYPISLGLVAILDYVAGWQ
eukprot:c28988_g1_i1 orf=255-2153(+)